MRRTLFLVLFLTALLGISSVWAVINVPNDYANLQDAITAATAGETIQINAGTYSVNSISISKSLTIEGLGTGATITRAGTGTGYFWGVSGTIDLTLSNITIDASGSSTTSFVCHLSGCNSVTVEDVSLIGQGKDYTTDGEEYYYDGPNQTNIVGGLDFNGVGTVSLTNVSVSGNSRNGLSFTNVPSIALNGFDIDDCGHSSSSGWAGLALYGTTTSLTNSGTNTIDNVPNGIVADVGITLPSSGSISITNSVYSVLSGPNSAIADAFSENVLGCPYKVYFVTYQAQAGYYNTQSAAVAAGTLGATVYGDFIVYDLTNDQFVVADGMKIQAAISAASDGHAIVVSDGTYTENVIVSKNISLTSFNGADATIIDGSNSGGGTGTITLTSGRNGVVIGTIDHGFTIKGIDGPAGNEFAAIYLTGAQTNVSIEGNIIEARGDAALMGQYNAANTNIVINANEITGKTFTGDNPAGVGFGAQFTLPNVPRQLVVFGGGSGTSNTQNFTFTNNILSGICGGLSITDNSGNPIAPTPQGNTIASLEFAGTNNIITGNTFSGTTTLWAEALRMRGPGVYTITGNTFNGSYPVIMTAQTTTPSIGLDRIQNALPPANSYGNYVVVNSGRALAVPAVYPTIQAGVAAAAAGNVVEASAGTFQEDVIIDKSITLRGQGQTTIVKGPKDGNNETIFIDASNATVEDLAITRDGNNVADWNNANGTLNLTGIQIGQNQTGNTIQNCYVYGNRNGVYLNNARGNTIQDNLIDNNRTGVQLVNNVSDNQIKNNTITNNWTLGFVIYNSGTTGSVTGLTVEDNNISGNWYSQVECKTVSPVPDPYPTDTFDFVSNWFGSPTISASSTPAGEPGYSSQIPVEFGGTATSPGGNDGKISGDLYYKVLYDPWYMDAAMTRLSNQNVQNTDTGEWFTMIQEAIDDTDTMAGHTIQVGPGTYNEAVTINTMVTLQGSGDSTIISSGAGFGIMPNVGGTSATERLVIKDFKITGSTYGIHISQVEIAHITLENLNIDGCGSTALQIQGTGTLPNPLDPAIVTDLIIENCKFNNSISQMGISVDKYSSVDGLYMNNCQLNGNRRGFYSQRMDDTKHGYTYITDVHISNTQFNNNRERAAYLEKFDNAVLDNIHVEGNGYESDSWNTGFEINLKYADYENIEVKNSTFINNGSGNTQGYGTGLNVKARDDAPSYSTYPASLTGLSIHDNEFQGNQRGIGIGEYGKVSDSVTDILIEDNLIYSNSVYGLVNSLTSELDASPNYWGDSYPVDDISGNVAFIPWWEDQAMTVLGYPPVHNENQDTWFFTIQNAIDDAATTTGDVIRAAAGTYNENVIVNKQVSILGPEARVKPIIDGGGTGVVVMIMEDNVTMSGFEIIGSGTTETDAGIGLLNVTGCDINHNDVVGNITGIGVVGGSSNTVTYNTVTNSGYGIALNNLDGLGGTIYDGATYTNVTYNQVSGSSGHGIYVAENCDNNIVTNNIVSSCAGSGIYFWKGHNGTIQANNVSGCDIGIHNFNAHDTEITGNTISDNASYGIQVRNGQWEGAQPSSDDLLISGNTISGNGSEPTHAAIMMQGSPNNASVDPNTYGYFNAVKGCTIEDNTITGDANGILNAIGEENLIQNGNDIDVGLYGIAFVYVSGSTIQGNDVSSTLFDAIALENLNKLTEDPAHIAFGSTGNNIKANTIVSNRDGIFLGDNCTGNHITDGNDITAAAGGVHVWRPGNITITDNDIHDCETGIRLKGSSNNTITGNTISGNIEGIKAVASWQVGVWYESENNTIGGTGVENSFSDNYKHFTNEEEHQTPITLSDISGVNTFDRHWDDQASQIIWGDFAEIYVDAPKELIKDEETQTYSVVASYVEDMRSFQTEVKILKEDFGAPSGFTIGPLFSAYTGGATLLVTDRSDATHWIYFIGGFYNAQTSGITGEDVVLFTFPMTSLPDASAPQGSLVDLTYDETALKKPSNTLIPCAGTLGKLIYIDSTEPQPVTWVTCHTTPDANNSVDLVWTNPADAFKNQIWRFDYADLAGANAYPAYNGSAFTPPDLPEVSSANGWTLVGTIAAAESYIDDGMDRGYYYYAVLVEDEAANVSENNLTRESISYWPGDVDVALYPDEGNGTVEGTDIAILSANWGLTTGTGMVDIVDVGPSTDFARRSRPCPDGRIDIEDMMMFAMNYYNTNYSIYPRNDEPAEPGDVTIAIDRRISGDALAIDLRIGENEGEARGLELPLAWGAGLSLVSVEAGDAWPEDHILLYTQEDNLVTVSASALGAEAVIPGNGIVATLVFDILGEDTSLQLGEAFARDADNQHIDVREVTGTTSNEDLVNPIPAENFLGANYPNPFNPRTTIQYGLKEAGTVRVNIYNNRGQLVNTLVNESKAAGTYQLTWNGRDLHGNPVSSGIYLFRMVTGDTVKTQKAMLLK